MLILFVIIIFAVDIYFLKKCAKLKKLKKNCDVEVDATIIDYAERKWQFRGRRIKTYRGTYDFYYNGKEYQANSLKGYYEFELENLKGRIVRIKINPNKPYEIYEKSDLPYTYTLYIIILTIILIAICFIISTALTMLWFIYKL